MKLLIKYKNSDTAFEYSASEQARVIGVESEKRELLQTLSRHVNVYWSVETVMVDGKEVTRPMDKNRVEAFLISGEGESETREQVQVT